MVLGGTGLELNERIPDGRPFGGTLSRPVMITRQPCRSPAVQLGLSGLPDLLKERKGKRKRACVWCAHAVS